MEPEFDDELKPEIKDEDAVATEFVFSDWQLGEIQKVISFVRNELVHPGLRPYEIKILAKLMLALSRLPQPTSDIEIDFSVTVDLPKPSNPDAQYDESLYCSLQIGTEFLWLQYGGYVITPGTGGDSYSYTDFEVHLDGSRDDPMGQGISTWISRYEQWCTGAHNRHHLHISEYPGDDSDLDWEDDNWQENDEETESDE